MKSVNSPDSKLDNKYCKQLRAIGHRLNPVVIVSNGVTEGVTAEIDRALKDHELIEVPAVVPGAQKLDQFDVVHVIVVTIHHTAAKAHVKLGRLELFDTLIRTQRQHFG